MTLKGTYRLKAPRDRVWEGLNDPSILMKCIPGCKQLALGAADSYDILMEVGIGAVKGRYTGKVRITDRIEGSQYRLSVTGSGSTGFVSAGGVVLLKELGYETIIEYDGQAQVGGLIAGVSQRVIEGVAKHLVGQFFKYFEKAVSQSSAGGGETHAAGVKIL